MVVVGLANAGALALQRLALHNRPTDDITDVNGLADSPFSVLAALLVAFALAPLVAVAQAATSRVVEGIAHGHRISGWSAIALAVRRPSGAVVQLLLFIVVTVLASSLVGLPIALLADRLLGGSDAGRRDRGPSASCAAYRRSARLTQGTPLAGGLPQRPARLDRVQPPRRPGGILLLITGWPFWMSNVVAIVAGAVLLPFSAIGLTLQFYDFRQEEARDRTPLGCTLEEPRPESSLPRGARRSRGRRTRSRGPRPGRAPGA